jgi:salicylate hydroxylase
MFPTTGQGACQCLEDAAALGILLSRLASPSDLSSRLELFQELRSSRVVEIHALSSVLLGREAQLGEQIRGVLPEGRVLGGPLDHLDITNG